VARQGLRSAEQPGRSRRVEHRLRRGAAVSVQYSAARDQLSSRPHGTALRDLPLLILQQTRPRKMTRARRHSYFSSNIATPYPLLRLSLSSVPPSCFLSSTLLPRHLQLHPLPPWLLLHLNPSTAPSPPPRSCHSSPPPKSQAYSVWSRRQHASFVRSQCPSSHTAAQVQCLRERKCGAAVSLVCGSGDEHCRGRSASVIYSLCFKLSSGPLAIYPSNQEIAAIFGDVRYVLGFRV
jgi:hypothetical protein